MADEEITIRACNFCGRGINEGDPFFICQGEDCKEESLIYCKDCVKRCEECHKWFCSGCIDEHKEEHNEEED